MPNNTKHQKFITAIRANMPADIPNILYSTQWDSDELSDASDDIINLLEKEFEQLFGPLE